MDAFKNAAEQTRHEAEIEELYSRAVQDPEALIASFDVPADCLERDFGGYANSTPLDRWQNKVDSVLHKMNAGQMLAVLNHMNANAGEKAGESRRCEIAQAVRQEVIDVTCKKYPKRVNFGPRQDNCNIGLADVLASNAHASATNAADVLQAEVSANPVPGMQPA